MNTLVVYDSQFGNTEQVARAIAARLEALGPVRVTSAAASHGGDVAGVDLLVIGGPTQGHRARQQLRGWVDEVGAGELAGLATATFDTRLRWPVLLSGSAARSIARALQGKGATLVAPPASFLVAGSKGPLARGEIARAGSWASALASQLARGAVAAG